MTSPAPIRWRLADDDAGQPALFSDDAVPGTRDLPEVQYLHVRARRIVSAVPEAARVPFRYSINAYRGCSHACTYCFARPTHEYLGLDGGRDFERRIVVKINAVERLRVELREPRLRGEVIAMGTNTDPYQPCEGRYRLTRGLVEVLAERGQCFSILTKSSMIVRDTAVLAQAASDGLFRAAFSIGTLDPAIARLTEPGAPPPAARVEALARLAEAGIPCSVLIAPVIPGMSDDEAGIEAVIRAVADAGARSVTPILLHLRPGVRELFTPWLDGVRPDLAPRYAALYRDRSGYARDRQVEIAALVQRIADRHGLAAASPASARGHEPAAIERPRSLAGQLALQDQIGSE